MSEIDTINLPEPFIDVYHWTFDHYQPFPDRFTLHSSTKAISCFSEIKNGAQSGVVTKWQCLKFSSPWNIVEIEGLGLAELRWTAKFSSPIRLPFPQV